MSAPSAEKTKAQIFRLDQSDALLRTLIESAAVGMALVGSGGSVIYANRAYQTMLGRDPSETLDHPVEEVARAADAQPLALRIDQVLRGETQSFRLQCQVRLKDGSPLWVLALGSAVPIEGRRTPLCLVQLIDIDREKKAEEVMARSEGRLNFALEAAGQGVWDYDGTRDEIYHSPTWRTMRGYSADEFLDPARDKWMERLHPDDVERIKSIVDKQEHGVDGFAAMEYRERHRDGHYIWILSRGRPVEWDANGRRTRAVGTDTDITYLKTIEAKLAEEKERLRVTLEAIGEGVISTAADGTVTFMNPVAEAMTGWLEANALGKPLRDVFNAKLEATGEPAADPVAASFATGHVHMIEEDVILAARDGTGRGVAGSAAPVRTEAGHTIGAVLVFKDNTEIQEEKRRLAHSANHDLLTGLPNRGAFLRALTEARRQVNVEQRMHALCFIDLDRFKPVNDTAGHAAGDALLQKVGQLIRRTCRSHDMTARLGGDEFVVLLADCTLANAHIVASKVVEAIGRLEFAWNGRKYRIGASVGLTMITTDSARDPLAEADAACYAAKAAGRGQVSTFAA